MARKKLLNGGILSIRELKVVRGTFIGVRELKGVSGEPITSKKYGNPLYVAELRDFNTGEVLEFWADGGLRGALKMGKVTEGQTIEIQHTGERDIEEGTVQTYDVYEIDKDE